MWNCKLSDHSHFECPKTSKDVGDLPLTAVIKQKKEKKKSVLSVCSLFYVSCHLKEFTFEIIEKYMHIFLKALAFIKVL